MRTLMEQVGWDRLPCAWFIPIRGWIMCWLPEEGGCITLVRNAHSNLLDPEHHGVGRFDCFEYALASLTLMED